MNYQFHYEALVKRAQSRVFDGPTESHHIIPRCMGGSDGKKNRVDLTPEEHFVAHQLLTKMHPNIYGLALAAATMARDNRNGKRSNNKLYGWLRRRAATAQALIQTGQKRSDEAKRNISAGIRGSAALREYYDSRIGVPLEDATKAKLSQSHKVSEKASAARRRMHARKVGVPRDAATKAKISEAFLGGVLSCAHRAAISAGMKGKQKTGEHLANISTALQGNQNARGATRSPETIARMRQAATKREEAKRLARSELAGNA